MIHGRRETFAIEVRPLSGPPPEGDPAAAATWAAMRMYVAGRNVFRNVRREDRTVSDDVNWPAIGLARWFVRSWTALFHAGSWGRPSLSRNSRDFAAQMDDQLAENFDAPDHELDERDHFVATHSLRAAAGGAALPDLWFARDGSIMSVAWHDSMDGEIFFTLSRREADLPANDVADAIRGFVEWVRDTLSQTHDTDVDEDLDMLTEWLEHYATPEAAIDGILSEAALGDDRWRRLARSAGVSDESPVELLGLGPEVLTQGTLAGAESSTIAMAFRCAAPVLSDDELVALRRVILDAPRNEAAFVEIKRLSDRVAQPAATLYDFTRGYRLAREIRRLLGNETEHLDVEELVDHLGIPVLDVKLGDPELDGGCVCDPVHGPVIFVNSNTSRAAVPWGRRVVLAHELCHLLFDRDYGVGLGVVSGPWAPPRIERTANAFAIELLLPLAGIVAKVGRAWESLTDAKVNTLMKEYELGITAVTEHVRNMADARNREA
ncbi:MAG: ImmA/IrrE family metallo-endopeptidase [Deltaproteobacteria bacterium]|nr:MAG: ImmA/IrrE family metallo-endopeptidase [Deltaproteobacteria bacterium]